MELCIAVLQVSSDIIKRCCHKIELDDLFDGRVEKSKEALEVRQLIPYSYKYR